MPVRRASDEVVAGAIITALRASATTASYTEIPQGTNPPYVKVNFVTGARQDTYGRYGKTIVFDTDCVTQGPSQLAGLELRDSAIQALEVLSAATLTGHTKLGCRYDTDTYFAEMVNGIKTHHHVASFWVWTEQSST